MCAILLCVYFDSEMDVQYFRYLCFCFPHPVLLFPEHDGICSDTLLFAYDQDLPLSIWMDPYWGSA